MQINDYIKPSEIIDLKKNLLNELKLAVEDPQRMERFTKFILNTHSYSLFNKWLIYAQCSKVTQVMGKNIWYKTYKRTLKAGEEEKAIFILAPLFKKEKVIDPKTKKEKIEQHLIKFKTVKVFDINQTEGPEVVLSTELGLQLEDPEAYFTELLFLIGLDGYSIDETNLPFKEASKVEEMTIHLNKALDLEGRIVELLNVLSRVHLHHFKERKDLSDSIKQNEVKMVTTIISNILGKPVNSWVDVDTFDNKSINAIFKAADSVAHAIGISLRLEK